MIHSNANLIVHHREEAFKWTWELSEPQKSINVKQASCDQSLPQQ